MEGRCAEYGSNCVCLSTGVAISTSRLADLASCLSTGVAISTRRLAGLFRLPLLLLLCLQARSLGCSTGEILTLS